MAQIKIYGLKQHPNPIKQRLSEIIHACVTGALDLPKDKRFHRFFGLAADGFIMPADRSEAYTIIEISMMSGRTKNTKKALIKHL